MNAVAGVGVIFRKNRHSLAYSIESQSPRAVNAGYAQDDRDRVVGVTPVRRLLFRREPARGAARFGPWLRRLVDRCTVAVAVDARCAQVDEAGRCGRELGNNRSSLTSVGASRDGGTE